MRGAVLYAPGDVRLDTRPDPRIENPTDAIIKLAATCVCGSDLWPYRGIEEVNGPAPMGHEYVGIIEEVGSDVRTLTPGQFVVGSFFASDNTCEICQAGYQSRCIHAELIGAIGTQAEYARIPLADGTLVATPQVPDDKYVAVAARGLRCARHRLVRRRRRGGRTRQDRRRRRRRRRRPARQSSPPANSVRNGSSHSAATRTARISPGTSAPPTSSPNAATMAWPASGT